MDYKTLFLIAGILAVGIGIVILVGGRSKKSIKAAKMFALIGAPILILGVLPFLGVGNYGSGQINLNLQTQAIGDDVDNGNGASGTGGAVDIIGCDRSATITYTLAGQDAYNGSAVGGTHRYRLNGGTWTTVSDAGTISGSPFQTLDVVWENGATGGYFSKYETYDLPCSVATFSPKLYINGSITSTEKDDAGTVIAFVTNNQTLAAGDVVDASVLLKGTFETAFPYGFDAVVEWNSSDIDDVVLMQNGVAFSLGTEPQDYTDYNGGVAVKKTYSVPALMSNKNFEFDVHIDSDDTNNPGSSDGCTGNITITYFAKNYYVDENAGGMPSSVASSQDEDQSLTRIGTTGVGTSTICYD